MYLYLISNHWGLWWVCRKSHSTTEYIYEGKFSYPYSFYNSRREAIQALKKIVKKVVRVKNNLSPQTYHHVKEVYKEIK